MAGKKVTVGIRIQADGVNAFVGDNKRSQNALARTKRSALGAGRGVTTFSASMTQANGVLRTFVGLGAATAIVYLGRAAVASADDFRVLDARIRVATIATNDYEEVSARLFAISQRNGTSLRETIKLFQNLARVAPELDANNDQMLEMLDLVQKVGVTSGASFDDMKFAMRQFGQSMASGVVRAEEFNSIVENVPELAFQIAKGLGVTVGQLRLAVIEGNVLSKEVFTAINKQGGEIELIFRGFPRSIQQAKTALDSGFSKSISKLNKELAFGTDEFVDLLDSVAEALAAFAEDDQAIENIARDLEHLVAVGKIAVSTFLAFKAGGLILGGFTAMQIRLALIRAELNGVNVAALSAAGSLQSASSINVASVAIRRQSLQSRLGATVLPPTVAAAKPVTKLATAFKGLSVAGSGALAVMGGVPGILLAGGIAATAYAASVAYASDESENLNETLERLNGDIKSSSLRKLNVQLRDYTKNLKDAQDVIADYDSDNSALTALWGRDLTPLIKARKNIGLLTEIIRKLKAEVSTINTATDNLATRLGLSGDEEFSQSFLDQLLKIKEAQDKVGKSKRQLALDGVNTQGVAVKNVQILRDEINATHDLLDAEEKKKQAKRDALAASKAAVAAAEAEKIKAVEFSKSLDDQAEGINLATTALLLNGRELAVHQALLTAGLLVTRELNAEDRLRKQLIIEQTEAYHQQKTAIEGLNAALDVELAQIQQKQKSRDSSFESIRKSLLTEEEAENESYAKRLQQLRDYGDNKANVEKDVAALVEKEAGRHRAALEDIANGGKDIKTLFDELRSSVDGWSRDFANAMVSSSGSFKDFAKNVIDQMQKIAIQQATQPLFNAFGDFLGDAFGGVFGGAFGGSGAISTLPVGGGAIHLSSFDGGGFTGRGSRSGGLDGKGGFLGLLHRNETVTDHTKQSGPSSSNKININIKVDASGSSVEGDEDQSQTLGRRLGDSVRAVLIQELLPNGLLNT